MKKTLTVLALVLAFGKANAQIYDPAPYCDVTVRLAGSSSFDAITSVQLNTLTRTITPSDSMYVYFNSGTATSLKTDSTYPLILKYNKFDGEPMIITVYIDYNHNNVFDSSEVVFNQNSLFTTGSNVVVNGTITVPHTALHGITRMRILNIEETLSDSVVANPCSGNTPALYQPDYGEAIDFNVDIIGSAAGVAEINSNPVDNKIYPNPATNTLHLSNDLAGASVTLTDMQGRTLATYKSEQNNELDISAITPGLYLVQIKKDEQVFNRMVSISR